MTATPAKLFFSYAHEDEAFKDKLIKHLAVLKRQSVIETWHDRLIAAGDEWKGAIDDNLENADIVLLLVSADFLASDYCWDVEMTRALERHEAGEARVIPIILRSADWHGAPFAKLQALPKDAKAVKEWADEDQAFTDIARGIRATIERPPSQAAATNAQQRATTDVLATWKRKLDFLREKEASESDAAALFKLKMEIEAAEQKIQDLVAKP